MAQPKVPLHLGLILDGNRRWAREHGLPQLEGHRRGYDNLHNIVTAAAERGVKYISAYVFSTENWNRSQEEVNYLMDMLVWVATKEIDKFVREDMKVVFLGSRKNLSAKVLRAIRSVEDRTAGCTRAVVALCFNYGGQVEVAEAVARMVDDGVKSAEVTPGKLSEYLYHPEVPPVDLLIRSSGELRTSGFMMWRTAYAELYFSPVPWPAFSVADLDAALFEYAGRHRRYGK